MWERERGWEGERGRWRRRERERERVGVWGRNEVRERWREREEREKGGIDTLCAKLHVGSVVPWVPKNELWYYTCKLWANGAIAQGAFCLMQTKSRERGSSLTHTHPWDLPTLHLHCTQGGGKTNKHHTIQQTKLILYTFRHGKVETDALNHVG